MLGITRNAKAENATADHVLQVCFRYTVGYLTVIIIINYYYYN